MSMLYPVDYYPAANCVRRFKQLPRFPAASCTKMCLSFIRHIKLPRRRDKNSFCSLISFLRRSLAACLLSLYFLLCYSLCPTYAANELCCIVMTVLRVGVELWLFVQNPSDSTTEHSCKRDWTNLLYHGCPNFSSERTTPLISGRFEVRTTNNGVPNFLNCEILWYIYIYTIIYR
jgi:hypothetical protein